MTSLKEHIARDLQRKINDDVVKAALRVLDLVPAEAYLALSLQSVCSTMDLTAQLMESDFGFSPEARHLSVYLVALMAAHAYATKQPMHNDALVTRARDDMLKLGLIPPRSAP
jgi:hypothetical protein